MGIIGAMAAQAFFDSKKIIKAQVGLLEAELEELTLKKPGVRVLEVGVAVSGSEAAGEAMKIWGGNLRVDHVMQAAIEHTDGPIAMIQQYSRANAFPCEFRMQLPVGAPAALALKKGLLLPSWQCHESQEEDPVVKAFMKALDEADIGSDLEFSQDLPGNMKMSIDWGIQIIPTGPSSTTLLVQTARIGFFTETVGVKHAAKIRRSLLELLEGWQGGSTDSLGPLHWAASLADMPIGVTLEEFLAAPADDAKPSEPQAEDGATSESGEEAIQPKGEEQPASTPGQGPNPALAAILSAFLPGVGQMMAGQGVKGAILLVVFFLTCGFLGLMNIVCAIDAYLIADKKNSGKPVGDWDFF